LSDNLFQAFVFILQLEPILRVPPLFHPFSTDALLLDSGVSLIFQTSSSAARSGDFVRGQHFNISSLMPLDDFANLFLFWQPNQGETVTIGFTKEGAAFCFDTFLVVHAAMELRLLRTWSLFSHLHSLYKILLHLPAYECRSIV
jgi:hypothetical protein